MASFILVLFALLSLCSCVAVDVPTNPEATSRISALKGVAVFPPDVQLIRTDLLAYRGVPQLDLDLRAAGTLGTLVAQELSRRGFQTRAIPRGNVATEVQRELVRSAAPVPRWPWSPVESPLEGQNGDAVQSVYLTLLAGGNLAKLDDTEVKQAGDGIVFVYLQGEENSHAVENLELTISVLALIAGANIHSSVLEDFAALSVALVDSKTGGVLWSNDASTRWVLGDKIEEPDLAALVTQVFEKFPSKSKPWQNLL
jgi:hypothetical protein